MFVPLRVASISVLVFAWTVICTAQMSPAANRGCDVTGIVLSELTHHPIHRALIDGRTDARFTDSDGRFELHIGMEQVHIQVRRPGYLDQEWIRPDCVTDGDSDRSTIYLTPAAIITGHIAVSGGDDADHVMVLAYRERFVGEHKTWVSAGHALTDDLGIFRMYELAAPARYLLCTQTSAECTRKWSRFHTIYGFASACFPAPDISFTLAPGQAKEVDISITRERFYPISISVTGSLRMQSSGVTLHEQNGIRINVPQIWNDQTKSIETWLPNGTYYAEGHLREGSPRYGRVDFRVDDAGVMGGALAMLPLPAIEVQFQKQSIKVAEPASAHAAVNLGFVSAEATVEGVHKSLSVPIEGAEGNNVGILSLSPGRYWIQVNHLLQGYYVSADAQRRD